MKKEAKKNNIIKFFILIILMMGVGFSIANYMHKQDIYEELKKQEEKYLKEINDLENQLSIYERELQESTSREYIEKYAREILKMVSPDEVYYDVNYSKNKKEEESDDE